MTGAPPGLQPERTSLAWQRTGLAGSTAALVLVRLAVARGSPLAAVLSGAMLLVSLAGLAQGSVRHRARRSAFDREAPLPGLSRVAKATAAGVVLLAAAGLLLVLRL